MNEANTMYLEDLDAETVADSLLADPIVTANPDLEGVLRPIVESAAGRGIENLRSWSWTGTRRG